MADTQSKPTHMVTYTFPTHMGGFSIGAVDFTLPAGWTPENRKWVENWLREKNGVPTSITGVFPYDTPGPAVADVRVMLAGLAGMLDKAAAMQGETNRITKIREVAEALHELGRRIR